MESAIMLPERPSPSVVKRNQRSLSPGAKPLENSAVRQLEQRRCAGHDVHPARLRHNAVDHAARARGADQQIVDAVAVQIRRRASRQRAEFIELELAPEPGVRLRQHDRLPDAVGRGEEDMDAALVVAVEHLPVVHELARRLADDEVHAAVGVQVCRRRLQRAREYGSRLQRRRAVAREDEIGVVPVEARRQIRAAEEHEQGAGGGILVLAREDDLVVAVLVEVADDGQQPDAHGTQADPRVRRGVETDHE
jgi:hypothetical protein